MHNDSMFQSTLLRDVIVKCLNSPDSTEKHLNRPTNVGLSSSPAMLKLAMLIV